MAQFSNCVDVLDLDTIAIDSSELVFLDDITCEFVGGGDAYNGY